MTAVNSHGSAGGPAATATAHLEPPTEEKFVKGPLLVVLAGTFMTFLDFFIVNVAIPDLRSDLHAGAGAVQFVVAGYGLALAVGLITGGRLGDLYGRRRMFALGMGLFVLASAGCGLSTSAGMLIGARVLQGVAAALLTPQVLALLGIVYSGAQRVKAFAAYGLVMGMAGVFGQLVGGLLIRANIDGSGWRAIFFINVPVGVVALIFLRQIPESRGGQSRLDVPGVILLSGALTAFVVPLVQGRSAGWPEWTWLSFAGAALLLAVFVGYQRTLERLGKAPLIPPELFAERTFTVGVGIGLTFSLSLASFWLILALYLQEGRGVTPLGSGALFVAAGVGFFSAMVLVPKLAAGLGKHILTVGSAVTGVGFLTGALTATELGAAGAIEWILPALLIAGFGIGLVLVPLSETVLIRVRPEHAASGAGVLTTALELGGALGVAIMGVIFFDALHRTYYAHAFSICMLVMTGCVVVAGVLSAQLPDAPVAAEAPAA